MGTTNNLALDTNIWLGIIENLEFDLLEELSENVKNNRLSILLPDSVELEFKRKLEKVLEETLKKNGRVSQQDLDSIVQTIFGIFDLSFRIKTEVEGIIEWVTSGKAPNHDANNYEDTIILNTLLTLDRGTDFWLVSLDSHFRSKNSYSLHPDIFEKFRDNGLSIKLSTDLRKTLYKELGIHRARTAGLNRYELYNWKAFRLQVNNKDIFDQLKEAIKYYYRELDFIPLSFLSNIYPFKSNEGSQTYFNGTTLKTDNKKLFDFFEAALVTHESNGIEINRAFFESDEEVSDFEAILIKLNENLVYNVGYGRKKVDIKIDIPKPKGLCQCGECTLFRCSILDVRSKIEGWTLDNSPKQLLKTAFYQFKIKDFYDALNTTQKILSEVNEKEYPTIYAIARENIFILERMWFASDDRFEEERKRIKLTKENQVLEKGITSIIGYLKYSKFFDYKFFDLSEDLEGVKKRYDIHNGLGHSYNSNIDWKNVIRWSEVNRTIWNNGLFFDYYTNIKRFAKITFKQNLYASKDRDVLYYINDYLFKTTFPYIKIEDYRVFFHELGVKALNFHKDSIRNIYEFFDPIVDSFPQVNKLSLGHPYRKHYLDQLKKIAFLLGYIDFPKTMTNSLILKIYGVYPEDEMQRDRKETLFGSLIQNRIEALNKKSASTYIKAMFNGKRDISFKIANIFDLMKQFKSIKLSNAQWEIFLSEDIEKETGYYRSYVLHKLYKLAPDNIKTLAFEKVNEIVNNDSGFDGRVYDRFCIEGVIQISKKSYSIFLEQVVKAFGQEEKRYQSDTIDREIQDLDILNIFLNHVYMHYDDPYNHLKQFLGRSDYYDFLINPDLLEEGGLNIHWFYIAYRKSYYAIKKIMSDHRKIRSFISKKILESRNDKYYWAYVDLMGHINE